MTFENLETQTEKKEGSNFIQLHSSSSSQPCVDPHSALLSPSLSPITQLTFSSFDPTSQFQRTRKKKVSNQRPRCGDLALIMQDTAYAVTVSWTLIRSHCRHEIQQIPIESHCPDRVHINFMPAVSVMIRSVSPT